MIRDFNIESLDSLLSSLIEKVRINTAGAVNKFTKNSTARGLLYAFASQISFLKGYISTVEASKFLSSCYGTNLDTYAQEYYGVTRKGSSKSSAELFVRAQPGTEYPAGTQFTSVNGVIFQSLEDAVVESPNDFTFIQVESVDYGSHTKVFANTITSCSNPPSTHISCTNLMAAIGGFDTESDEDLRTRLYSIPHRVSQSTPKMIESLVYSLFPAVSRCSCIASSYGKCYLGVLKTSGANFTSAELAYINSTLADYLGYAEGLNLDVRNLSRINLSLEINATVANGSDFLTIFRAIQVKLLSYLEPRFYNESKLRADILLAKITEISGIIDVDQESKAFQEDIQTPYTTVPFIRNLIVTLTKESGEVKQYSSEINEDYYSAFSPNITSNLREVL